jgi:hypothetical protein
MLLTSLLVPDLAACQPPGSTIPATHPAADGCYDDRGDEEEGVRCPQR